MFDLNNKNRGKPFTFLKKKGEGFTLIEVIVSILVVTVGVLAAYTVTQKIVSYTYQVSSRLTAAYLAKEGIEIVRNIRDTNWLQGENWNSDLVGVGTEKWEADYTTRTFKGSGGAGEDCSQIPYYNCEAYDPNNYLRIDGGFYNYVVGPGSKFKREITITPTGADELMVSVEVFWEEKGEVYGPITVQEILYNWDPL